MKKLNEQKLREWLESTDQSILSVLGSTRIFVKAEAEGSGIVNLYSQYSRDGHPSFRASLDYVGFYDRISKKLYGDFHYYLNDIADESCCELYGCDFNSLTQRCQDDVKECMKTYAFENESVLIEKARSFYADSDSMDAFKTELEEHIRLTEEAFILDKEVSFWTPSYERQMTDSEMITYIRNRKDYTFKCCETFAAEYYRTIRDYQSEKWLKLSYEEDLGARLIFYRESQKRFAQLKNGVNKRLQKTHDVIYAVKELCHSSNRDICNVRIVLEKGEKRIEFSYPAFALETARTFISDIGDKDKRACVAAHFSQPDRTVCFDIMNIAEMSYRKNIFYSNSQKEGAVSHDEQ